MEMSTDNLSKTLYCLGVQCPKMLWLKKHRPELFDEYVMNQAVLKTGNEVGDLAMGLFGDFIEVTYSKELSEMITETQRLLAEGVSVIAEASFAYSGMFCSVDILKNRGSGRVELYEVKSSTEMKEIYFHDIAYQVYVLEKCGLTVEKAALVHIDSSYIRGKELEIEKLFKIEDVTEIVRSMQGDVAERTATFKEMLRLTDEPEQCLGHQCFSPYDCGFWAHCTEELPEKNVFRISGMQTRTKLKYYNQGIISFEELTEKAKLNEGQRLQIVHAMQELPDHIDRESVREFLAALSYPLYFLDFETFQPAIPLYENSSPYEQIVFQYSLHSYDEEGGELKHREFLAEPGADPRIQNAVKDLRDQIDDQNDHGNAIDNK